MNLVSFLPPPPKKEKLSLSSGLPLLPSILPPHPTPTPHAFQFVCHQRTSHAVQTSQPDTRRACSTLPAGKPGGENKKRNFANLF